MLTDQELRQAVFALQIIEDRGDPDEFQEVLREAMADAPPRDELTLGDSLRAGQLSRLLNVDRDRCEAAVSDAWGSNRQRRRFVVIVKYAIELIGPCRELTGQSPFVPYAETPLATAPAARRPSTIRIVGDREAVA